MPTNRPNRLLQHLRRWLRTRHGQNASRALPMPPERPLPEAPSEVDVTAEHPVLRRASEATAALVRQGWNVHRAPYGYRAMDVAGTRSGSGRPRTRLTPDPLRAPVVQHIFYWRAVTGLDVDQITQRLNNNPDRYPPPGTTGTWHDKAVTRILTNLKYTGYQALRTRDESNRLRPAEQWVLSDQPAHRALITTALFWAAQNPTTDTRRALRHRLLAQPHDLST